MTQLNYKATPIISQFMTDTGFIRGIIGPLGSGKSAGCVMTLLQLAAMQPKSPKDGIRRSRFIIIRNTYRMLRDTTIKTVHDWIPPNIAGQWKDSSATFKLKFQDIESEWMFRPMETPDDVRNLLSLEVTAAWLNEYRELDPQVLINLLGRVGRYPSPIDGGAVMRGIIMDSNPPPVGSFWYDLFEEGVPVEIEQAFLKSMEQANSRERGRQILGYHRQPGGMAENAENKENLPAGYYELLIAANAHRGQEWVDVHVHGQYGQDPNNSPVYPEFRMDLHAPKPTKLLTNPKLPLLIGMDFGRTPSMVVCQHTPEDWWNVLAEYNGFNVDIEEFLDRAIPWLKANFPEHSLHEMTIYGDPAGSHRSQNSSKTCFQIIRAHGIKVIPGPQSPDIRMGSVRRCLTGLKMGRPRLVVDQARAPVLAKGMAGGYCFDHTREGELQPHPKKNSYSHPNDALQYVIGWHEGPTIRAGGQKSTFGSQPIKAKGNWKVFR